MKNRFIKRKKIVNIPMIILNSTINFKKTIRYNQKIKRLKNE